MFFIGCQEKKGTETTIKKVEDETKIATSNEVIKLVETENEMGFVEVPLTIVEYSNWNGYLNNRVQAISDKDTIELMISLIENMPQSTFVKEGIKISSTGSNSDKFMTQLSRLYGVEIEDLKLKKESSLTIANLNRKKVNYKGYSSFKAFLEEGEQHGEIFVNFNFKEGEISINEKDPEYRIYLE